jgi:Skp family chaperone for outer membrane proteins
MTTKKIYGLAAGLVLCIGLLCFFWYTTHSILPKSSELRVAVIDSDRLKKQAKPFKDVHDILEREHAKAHEEILSNENQLRKEFERIKSEKNSSIAQTQKAKLDKKVEELEKKLQKKKGRLEKHVNALAAQLEETVFSVIKAIAAKRDINLIINSTINETRVIFYTENRFDITDDVIKDLEKRLPQLVLPKDDDA